MMSAFSFAYSTELLLLHIVDFFSTHGLLSKLVIISFEVFELFFIPFFLGHIFIQIKLQLDVEQNLHPGFVEFLFSLVAGENMRFNLEQQGSSKKILVGLKLIQK